MPKKRDALGRFTFVKAKSWGSIDPQAASGATTALDPGEASGAAGGASPALEPDRRREKLPGAAPSLVDPPPFPADPTPPAPRALLAPAAVDPATGMPTGIDPDRFEPYPADPGRFVIHRRTGKKLPKNFAAKMYQTGEQGSNPRIGRPRKKKFSEVVAAVLERSLTKAQLRKIEKRIGGKLSELQEGDTSRIEALAVVFVEQALAGSLESFREIADRVDPKPRRLEISGRDGAPVATAIIARGMTDEEAAAAYQSMIDGARPADGDAQDSEAASSEE